MTCSYRLITTDLDWDKLEFTCKGSKFQIPNAMIFEQFFHFPSLNSFTANNILDNYFLDDKLRSEINQIIDRESFLPIMKDAEKSIKTWKKIEKIIKKSNLDTQENKLLYTFFSLQRYRLPMQPLDDESYSIFREHSNSIIYNIENSTLRTLSTVDKIAKKFCDIHDLDWNLYTYNKCLRTYVFSLLPYPLKIIRNIDKDDYFHSIDLSSKILTEILLCDLTKERKMLEGEMTEKSSNTVIGSFQRQDKINKIKSQIREREKKLNLEVSKRIYTDRINESLRKTRSLFPDYRASDVYYHYFLEEIVREYPEYITEMVGEASQTNSLQKSLRANQIPSDESLKLCQCQFCYRYSSVERPGNGRHGWDCDRYVCRKKYDAWNKHLNRQGICLSDLYQDE